MGVLLTFSRAKQPTAIISQLKLPAHAQVPCLEVIADFSNALERKLDADGIFHPADRAAKQNELAHDIATIIDDVATYAPTKEGEHQIDPGLYAAALLASLGDGAPNEFGGRHADSVRGFFMAQATSDLDFKAVPPAELAKSYPDIVFVRQIAMVHNMRAAVAVLSTNPPQGQPDPFAFKPYADFVNHIWPRSDLSARMAVLAKRIRNLMTGYPNPAARHTSRPA